MNPSPKSRRPLDAETLPDQSKQAPAVPSPLPSDGRGEGQGEVRDLADRSLGKWIFRTLIIAASLTAWFWTQFLIGHRPVGNGIADKVHEFTQPANDYLQTHPRAANSLLIASSAVIDSLGIFLIAVSIFGKTLRPFIALLIVFGMRQLCQWLCALPPPEQMIWRNPGFPSLLVTYGVANDLFFSGHTAIAVLGAIEFYRLFPRLWALAVSVAVAMFEISAVLMLRAHWTMDVVTGAMAAILAAIWAEWLCSKSMTLKR